MNCGAFSPGASLVIGMLVGARPSVPVVGAAELVASAVEDAACEDSLLSTAITGSLDGVGLSVTLS